LKLRAISVVESVEIYSDQVLSCLKTLGKTLLANLLIGDHC